MKSSIAEKAVLAVTVMTSLAFSVAKVAAQSAPASAPENAQAASPGLPPAVRLSHGVPEILNLARAQVGDDIIIAYIGNSGTIYNLSASEIVYLKGQGVSDPVLTAMLQQRQKLARTSEGTASPNQATATTSPANSADVSPQPAPTYAQPSSSAQVAPQYAPSSSVYVIPSPSPTYYYSYPGYYPYYGGYYGYGYPSLSFAFGFGSGYYRGGYHGGHYGGGYHGGGSHTGHH